MDWAGTLREQVRSGADAMWRLIRFISINNAEIRIIYLQCKKQEISMCLPSRDITLRCKSVTFYDEICGNRDFNQSTKQFCSWQGYVKIDHLKAAEYLNTYNFPKVKKKQKLGSKVAISIGCWIAIIEQPWNSKRRIETLNQLMTIMPCFDCAFFHMNSGVLCYLTRSRTIIIAVRTAIQNKAF